MNARTLLLTTFAASTLFLGACSSDDDNGTQPPPQDNTITGRLTTLGLTQLATLVTAADLGTTLSGTGPFTLFAPTNAAIAALPAAQVAFLTDPANQADLVALLQYHLVNGQNLDAAAVTALTSLTMDAGGDTIIGSVNGQPKINQATIAIVNQSASNGTIHIIDSVLRQPVENVTASLVTDEFLLTNDLIVAAGLDTAINGGGVTLIAPTDAAWNALPAPNDLAFYQDPTNVADLTALLGLHLYPAGVATAADAIAAGDVPSFNGELLFFNEEAGPLTVNNVDIVRVNRPTLASIYHGVDAVLTDPGTIVDVATDNGNFTALLGELVEAGLDDDLNGTGTLTGPFTVFAPSDTAITDFVANNGNTTLFSDPANQALATQVLSYHVIEGDALQGYELENVSSLTTAESTAVFLEVNATTGALELRNAAAGTLLATVVQSNVYANNGVIHVIDSVLLPDGVVLP